MFLLQMSGVPGAGKTTLAKELARVVGAVRLDHDVVKSGLLEAGITVEQSGRASYEVLYALARDALGGGSCVIIDSPCFWPRILAEGQAMAKEHGAAYKYIECKTADLSLVDSRLRTRKRLRSQRLSIDTPPVDHQSTPGEAERFARWADGMQRPDSDYLVVDTATPVSEYLPTALAYLARR
ncbi:AAA family ATPase [Kribbella albertanoniae]|uniref:ATP-binding protein n=1 Tax=Kribbella albertanoniae TaxID=1266829 RepID=A0A4R4Q9P7_9ACTN|nr:ATP-binding protein [Kribbella albertanoniae]TDC31703.1 ATP-binding protein [Kribbella albertanoniae]